MLVQAGDRFGLDRDQWLVEATHVVVERFAPDVPAGAQIVASGRPQLQAVACAWVIPARRQSCRRLRHGRLPLPLAPPVGSRSSAACMNVSRSPARTAVVFDVSAPARRCVTIW